MEEIIVEEQTPKKWEFRKLKGVDVFLMTPIIKKIGIDKFSRIFGSGDIVKSVTAKAGTKQYESQVEAATFGAMLEAGQIILEGLDVCKNEILNLLEKTSNLSLKEIEDLDLVELPEMIIDFVKKDEFKDFLKVAQRFVK